MSVTHYQTTSDIPLILQVLKKVLKAHDLRYQDVADRLNVSKITVARHLSGHGLTLEVVEQLCGVVNLRLGDIMDMVNNSRRETITMLSQEQEEGLQESPFTAVILILLQSGWTYSQLQDEFKVSDIEINKHLIKLDKLKLIELHPFNRVKILISKSLIGKRDGPIQKMFDSYIKNVISNIYFGADTTNYRYTYHRLSQRSIIKVVRMFDDAMRTVEQLAAEDRDLPHEITSWQSLLFVAHPIELANLI
jgi:hypothetical protein